MALALMVWGITSLVATVEENRTTWLLLAMIALAGRLGMEEPEGVAECFHAINRIPAADQIPVNT
jgi:hypothetical protein